MQNKQITSQFLFTQKDISRFQRYIFIWWKTSKRDLPWRHTHDPYNIFISEIMLQQTQVDRVIPKYVAFLEKFPNIQSLAHAKKSEVLVLWKGLGYNRRALYVHASAEYIMHNCEGKFPTLEKELLLLPGVGKYTARAIQIFAFKKYTYCIDINIRKIIEYHFFNSKNQKESDIEQAAKKLVPKGKSWEWHQALMDYGALALPKSKNKLRTINYTKPFKETDRFFRGRIVDLLRESEVDEEHLLRSVCKEYKKPDEYIKKIIKVLRKDGLLTKKGGRLSLPV